MSTLPGKSPPPPPSSAPPAPPQNTAPRANGNWLWVFGALALFAVAAALLLRTTPHAEQSPIYRAVHENDLETLHALLEADPGLASTPSRDHGATPLHWAAAEGNLEAVKLLAHFHADPNLVHQIAGTPLHVAVAAGHRDVAAFLIDHGAQLNARDPGGRTAVFLAVQHNLPDLLELLLARNADPNIPDHDWVTPLQQSRLLLDKNLEQLLLAAGATELAPTPTPPAPGAPAAPAAPAAPGP